MCGACEGGLFACQGEDSTTSSGVLNKPSMHGGGADEGVGAVDCVVQYRVFESGVRGCRTPYEEGFISNILIADCVVGSYDLFMTVCGTAER